MKVITKIQSFSDVITNSSSEVFLMSKSNADYYKHLENTYGCIAIDEITWEWIENNIQEWEMVCDYLGLDKELISTYHEFKYSSYGWWETPEQEDWLDFLSLNREKIEKDLVGLYYVDIKDHFPDAYEVTDNARDDALWSDSRH